MAASSPTGTSRPKRPPSRISAGPLGQSVLTTGQPQASASAITLQKPSWRELTARTDARAIQANGLAVKPGKSTSSATPRPAACAR